VQATRGLPIAAPAADKGNKPQAEREAYSSPQWFRVCLDAGRDAFLLVDCFFRSAGLRSVMGGGMGVGWRAGCLFTLLCCPTPSPVCMFRVSRPGWLLAKNTPSAQLLGTRATHCIE